MSDRVSRTINRLMPTLNFTTEKDMGDSINFLDIRICREENNFSTDMWVPQASPPT